MSVRTCIVVGAGLAGSAVAASLARRGWSVEVIDAAAEPASGASGLPVGLLAPHQSADDNLLSQLSRAGVRCTLDALQALRPGIDWAPTGVLESGGRMPPDPSAVAPEWTSRASAGQMAVLAQGASATWHSTGGWVRPAALVRHWLGTPGVRFRGGVRVAAVERIAGGWQLRSESSEAIGSAPVVVLAAALETALLHAGLPLSAVRGQVSWAPGSIGQAPSFPVNGNGHYIPAAWTPDGPAWYCGSTFVRGDVSLEPRREEHASNLARLRALVPAVAREAEPLFDSGSVRAWTGTRCASSDRRPLVGEAAPGLWLSCAMGSRGLTFAALCGELIAAKLHSEPLPVPVRLADALALARTSR